ncbi:NAD(P)H-dependent oxidoreductase [Chitinophaga sancti]|uniref:FMN-dependent NADH-azoreductase n=1 Tax=Chitinophaga sancti TaxID=1004 RepID=UPI002A76213A|nr:NAD(P)H-dependent oxidoreductase [Chitinophaga sancti]WPQ64777.1 NAD(P)H-dependent oxidoreductase [Chitinophaga sancti]
MRILHLITSPRKSQSYSAQLGNAIVEKLTAAHPGSTVVVRDLAAAPFPHLEEAHIQSFFTPEENRSAEQVSAIAHSDEAIAELLAADVVVIGAPMYNFSITSNLKSWIDHIARRGKTFSYGANGPEGLVKGKKVYLAISTGGVYSEGMMKVYDYTENYLRAVLGFMGMTDVTAVRAEGLSVPGVQDTAMEKAYEAITV